MLSSPAPQTLRVDFYLDLICPWCWIGLRNLQTAWASVQQQHPEWALETVWHAETLLPQIPAQGIPYQAFYEARLGGAQAVAMRREHIRAAAAPLGLPLNFECIETFPNSGLACALVNAAQSTLGADGMYALVNSLFHAFFAQGQNIGAAPVLHALAQAAGVPEGGAAPQPGAFGGGHAGGVPHLVFNAQWPVTGAVPARELERVMLHAIAQVQPNLVQNGHV